LISVDSTRHRDNLSVGDEQGSSDGVTFIFEEVVDATAELVVESHVDDVAGRRVCDVVLMSAGTQRHGALSAALRQRRVDTARVQARLRRTQVDQREIDELSDVDRHRPRAADLAAARRRRRSRRDVR